jgi:hypothetical protein
MGFGVAAGLVQAVAVIGGGQQLRAIIVIGELAAASAVGEGDRASYTTPSIDIHCAGGSDPASRDLNDNRKGFTND